MVIEKAEVNNFNIPNLPMGLDNGYVYFGDNTRYKVQEGASTPTTPGSANQAPLLTAQESIRLSGLDRYETAVAISKNGWAAAENVVLATSNSFAGALAGSSLAYLKDAPVLLTDAKALPSVTTTEIARLGAKTVYIIGNQDEVSQEIENQLKAKYEVVRISGSDQFNTAVKIGEEVKRIKAFDTVVLATQNDFPDALAITPFSAKNTMPILFSGKDKIRDDTRAALQAWGIKKVVIAGGTGVISQAVESELQNIGINVTRLAGEDRYDTALAIVKHFENTPYTKITLATGLDYPDALTGAALAAKKGLPLFLVEKDDVKESVKAYLDAHKLEQVYIFGGEGVIAKNIVGISSGTSSAGTSNSNAGTSNSSAGANNSTSGSSSGSSIPSNISIGPDNSSYTKVLADGRYSLRAMYNYLNITSDGKAEMRKVTPNPVYEVKRQTDGTYTIKTSSGKYLGISGTIVDGVQLQEVSSPFYWKLYSENNNDIFSIRPASNLKVVVNAKDGKNTDGTLIILSTYESTNAPNNAEFRFIPVE